MLQAGIKNDELATEHYDRYSSMIYGIIIRSTPLKDDAEKILINTFTEAVHQKLFSRNSHCIFLGLVKLAVANINKHTMLKESNVDCFKTLPLLNQLINATGSMQDICDGNKMSRQEAAKLLRKEIKYNPFSFTANTKGGSGFAEIN